MADPDEKPGPITRANRLCFACPERQDSHRWAEDDSSAERSISLMNGPAQAANLRKCPARQIERLRIVIHFGQIAALMKVMPKMSLPVSRVGNPERQRDAREYRVESRVRRGMTMYGFMLQRPVPRQNDAAQWSHAPQRPFVK